MANTPSSYVTPVIEHGGLAFFSGQLPRNGNVVIYPGRVGETVDLDAAREAARVSAEACVTALRRSLGSRFLHLVKITGFVASAPGFTEQGKVIDAASQVFIEQLGASGRHARSAIGVAQLPHGASVEIEFIAAVKR